MFPWIRRHPIPIEAWFDYSLVLTYAVRADVVASLIGPRLELETVAGDAFLAVAMVRTRDLRPRGLPRFAGQDFFLSGYRLFTRLRTRSGRRLRGLRILRSDADRFAMVVGGNLLTHYNYHWSRVEESRSDNRIEVRVTTRDGSADCHVVAHLSEVEPKLPESSPFRTWREARRFAGPLPYTFDDEPDSGSIIRIEGVRSNWNPQPVAVDVRTLTFLVQPPFDHAGPRLAAAFVVQNIPYLWKRGVLERLERTS